MAGFLRTIALALLLLAAGLSSPALAQEIVAVPVAQGLDSPLAVVHAGDGSGDLFIVEQQGRILLYRGGALLAAPFLDIRARVGCCGERGLLGLTFHPDYANNGEFFLNYTDTAFNTVVARYRAAPDGLSADPAGEQVLLRVEQPFSNHNGGQLAFGPDGYLYVGLGDGGSGGDPGNNAQNPDSLLGKLLRLDVDAGLPYGIPAGNPLAAGGGRAEIWALGLRNPWRFSFDRLTGDLFIADVGQDALEEVNLQPAASGGGENYGWRLMEGSRCFQPASGCDDGSLTLPVLEYLHQQGRCSVTGGYRYRGRAVAALYGRYVYGDFCSGEIFAAAPDGNGQWQSEVLLRTAFAISAFGEDEGGELYVADLDGGVYRLTAPLSISPASGVYLRSQAIDLSVIVRSPAEVLDISATLNGNEVSRGVNNCLLEGSLASGGSSFRCPAIPLSIVEPGLHRFTVEVRLADGSVLGDAVQWEILENAEP